VGESEHWETVSPGGGRQAPTPGNGGFFKLSTTSDIILYAEDDDNDAFLFQRAFGQAGVSHRLVIVEDGKTAIEYIAGNGAYTDRAKHPLPCLALLDLNMPGISGIEVLKWIRANPDSSDLPVIVLSSSNQDGDVHRAYLQGANSYLVKPSKLEDMVIMARAIKDYWLIHNRGGSWVQEGEKGQS
jgi:CheY-like chemotaxis protein